MKRFIFLVLILSSSLFAQENITAYYQYKTSFLNNDIGLNGVSIVYELNQKGDEASFETKKNQKFYDGDRFSYVNFMDKIIENQQFYKGNKAIVYDNFKKVDWVFNAETKMINNCSAKRADYEFVEGKLTHTVEVWYCPSEFRFSPLSLSVQLFDIPGYVLSYKEKMNNKSGLVVEYNLLEFKENNNVQVKKPKEGERISYELVEKGFTTN